MAQMLLSVRSHYVIFENKSSLMFNGNVLFLISVFNLLDELSHVLAQCFTARPLTFSMPIKRMGASMLLMTVQKDKGKRKGYFYFHI